MSTPTAVSLLALALCAGLSAAQSQSYSCFQAAIPPAMDGMIAGDPVWDALPSATGFSKLGAGYTTDKQTVFRACWDEQALYLGVVCEEPDVARMKFSTSDGGDGWLDDGIEIFVQPGGPGAVTYQLVVTARGARSCGVGAPDFTKVQAVPATGEGFYALEVRIPHAVLEARPTVGGSWRANICRNIFTKNSGGDQFTSWAPLTRQFFEPEHFGVFALQGPAPPAEALTALNREVNAGYRRHLLGSIRDVALLAPEYAGVLNEAVRDDAFGRRARDLRREWRRLERLVRQAQDAPTDDLRQASLGAAGLQKDSYELKYRYLIHTLLVEN